MALPLILASAVATAMTALAVDRRTLSLYHGAQRFEGPPSIMAHRKGHAEHGPGIYLTTSWETAKRYSKGGGSVYRFEIDQELGWLEDKKVSLERAVAFLKSLPRMRKRDEIIASITRLARGEPEVRLEYVVNALVNADQSSGQHGPAIAAWLVEHGADVSHVQQSNEDWVVLFNPKKVVAWSKLKSEDVGPGFEFDLPAIKPRKTPSQATPPLFITKTSKDGKTAKLVRTFTVRTLDILKNDAAVAYINLYGPALGFMTEPEYLDFSSPEGRKMERWWYYFKIPMEEDDPAREGAWGIVPTPKRFKEIVGEVARRWPGVVDPEFPLELIE